MCGIGGIINLRSGPVETARLEALCAHLAHRGPDDRGVWQSTGSDLAIGLAHTRLAVIDPHPAGHQPMVDATGRYALIFNGIIYNYPELREELLARGYVLRSQTDTEVLLLGLSCWGTELLERLSGMWAFCFYDAREQQGWLCRDRFGIKPLLYSQQEQELVFASEMQALRRVSTAARPINEDALRQYLHYGYISAPQTIYQHYHKLPPGHLLRFDRHGFHRPERYYHLKVAEGVERLSYSDATQELRRRVAAAVRRRTRADVPLGAFLSGGVDSTIIVGHLAEQADTTPKTFSIGFADQPRYDETAFARLVAERLGSHHQEFRLTYRDVLDHLPQMLDHLGEPFADASLIPTSLVSRMTRRQVTVALSGDGGDELFGGYHRYRAHFYWQRYHRYPAWLRHGIVERGLLRLPTSKRSLLGDRVRQLRKLLRSDATDPRLRHQAWSSIMSSEAEELLELPPPAADLIPIDEHYEQLLGSELWQRWRDDPLNQIMLLDIHDQLPNDMLNKVDLASMAHNLEVRVPLLDPEVVEFAAALPSAWKLTAEQSKRILVDAHRDLLPPEVIRRRKMGFELPIGEFLRKEWRDLFMEVVSPAALAAFPMISINAVQTLYKQHEQQQGEHADLLYALLVLCWWSRRT
ncbi:MAG: Asparagine synthetase [glutamine-hydrolyzing] 1 [Phycisphaerae bacterium]|nr:Asparagine synthetase [glutamine-hydrolyzing] 1 [Phycisphaerae bacterium]